MKVCSKLSCVILIGFLFCTLSACYSTYNVADVSFNQAKTHDGNLYQYHSDTLLTVVNEQLYLYSSDGMLKVFEDGKLRYIWGSGNKRVGLVDEYIYYTNYELSDEKDSLYRYQISTGDELCIADPIDCSGGNAVWINETLYVPTPKWQEYHGIQGKKCEKPSKIQVEFQFGNHRCYFDNFQFTYEDTNTQQSKVLDLDTESLLIPYKGGLLVVPGSKGEVLYYVTAEGEWVEFGLDSTECRYINASVNYYKDAIYVSFQRIGQQGFWGYVAYDDDTISGTYKIDTKDNSVTKINDRYYTSIYVFDDAGLYVTAPSGSVYKLDFDGNVVEEIVRQDGFGDSYNY